MVERRNDDDTRKGNCCNLWGKKELYEDHQGLRRGRGTISWGLTSGTEVAAKAREKGQLAITYLFRLSSGQCSALSVSVFLRPVASPEYY